MGADVYSIGFHVSEVEKGKLTLEFITGKIAAKSFEIKDTEVVFLLNDGDLKNDYKDWIEQTFRRYISYNLDRCHPLQN